MALLFLKVVFFDNSNKGEGGADPFLPPSTTHSLHACRVSFVDPVQDSIWNFRARIAKIMKRYERILRYCNLVLTVTARYHHKDLPEILFLWHRLAGPSDSHSRQDTTIRRTCQRKRISPTPKYTHLHDRWINEWIGERKIDR